MTYDDNFFASLSNESYSSANEVIPRILSLFDIRSVVDVGCGVGTWLRVVSENGVVDITGIDGDYVNDSHLQIPKEHFVPLDITGPIKIERQFDLCMCMEVSEHLPGSYSDHIVSSLTKLSNIVLFSAAIPEQGGTNHINERWQSEWVKLFCKHDYEPYYDIRVDFWGNHKVADYYRQNMFLFVNRKYITPIATVPFHDVVHPEVFHRRIVDSREVVPRVPVAVSNLVKSLKHSVKHRLSSR